MTEQNVKAGAKFAVANASAIASFAQKNQQLVKNVATTAYEHEMQNKNKGNNGGNDFMNNFSNMNINQSSNQNTQKKQNANDTFDFFKN